MFTLTICFIILNASIEFVLIYRPHPVEAVRVLLDVWRVRLEANSVVVEALRVLLKAKRAL